MAGSIIQDQHENFTHTAPLQLRGVTKVDFCLALGGINNNSLNTFLAGKKDDQRANVTYRQACHFLEKKQILDNEGKTTKRLTNEAEHPYGFSTERPCTHKWDMAR